MNDPATANVRLDRRHVLLYAFGGVVLGLVGSLAASMLPSVGMGGLLLLVGYRTAVAATVTRFVARGQRLHVFAWFATRDAIMFAVAVAVVAVGLSPRTAALLLAALTLAFA